LLSLALGAPLKKKKKKTIFVTDEVPSPVKCATCEATPTSALTRTTKAKGETIPVGIQASLRALQKRLQACEKSRRRQKVSDWYIKEKLRRLDGNSSIRSGVRHIRKKVSSAFALLLDNQLRNSGKKPHGRRFTIEDKLQGISMYQRGPRLYRALMEHMCLPHPESLNSTMGQIELLPGLQPGIKRMLQRMGEKMKTSFRDCILLVDEIHLRHGFTYDKKRDRTIGVVDYDQLGRQEESAKSALVQGGIDIYMAVWRACLSYAGDAR